MSARDIMLGTDGDLALEAGDLVLVEGAESIAQRLTLGLSLFRGEWALDPTAGIPFLQEILGQKPRIDHVREIFREAILATPGVGTLDSLTVEQTGRELSIDFRVTTDEGELVEDTVRVQA